MPTRSHGRGGFLMARRKSYKRDALGRFAETAGGPLAGAAAGAAVGGLLGSKTARKRLVAGSIPRESFIGTTKDGKWTGAKIGARYQAPGGREVLVKGIVGVSRKPAIRPTAPGRKTSAGTKLRR
ncbi:hypothetical protein [Rhodococcus sp. NPDC127528]|uniref:hypothetical protein n=1 Tax=unclassified Rhodococcus (in: high G+C Gram-positive bacteria) TaxID=192944 RepID=UPI0036298EE5